MFRLGSLLEAPAGRIRFPRLHSALPAWIMRIRNEPRVGRRPVWNSNGSAECLVVLAVPLDPMGRRWLAPVLRPGWAITGHYGAFKGARNSCKL
jgi:hypothetical protein